jgi:hypothetical protein
MRVNLDCDQEDDPAYRTPQGSNTNDCRLRTSLEGQPWLAESGGLLC